MIDLKAHLKTLSETHAPSGHEAPIRAILRETWSPFVQAFEQDGLGSLIGIKRATHANPHGYKIMLAAHMDEIGMMVRDIMDGFIVVHRISGVDNRLMLAKPVIVHGKRPLKGIVAAIPPHLQAAGDGKTYPTFDEFVIDVGLPDDEVRQLVRVGDLITPDVTLLELNNGFVAGKAFDDRACVAIITRTLELLQGAQHTYDVFAVATVQEENGLYGALTAAQMINPTLAIALDVTFGVQSGVAQDSQNELGGGGSLALGCNFHPKLFDALLNYAKQNEIKHQIEPIVANSGTDAWAIQVALEGIPCALISLPIRNMHSPNETCDMKDIERCARWLAGFIASLDESFITQLAL